MLRLVVEEIDPETACIENHAFFEIDNVAELSALVDIGPDPDLDRYSYPLSADEASRLKAAYDLTGISGVLPAQIHARPQLYDLPYLVHTRRELKFMLAGTKPFAFFCYHTKDSPEFRDSIEGPFRPHVEAGRIHLNEHVPNDSPDSFYAFYTLPGEEWRVGAFLDLRASNQPWTEEMTRKEGSLLGYEDWQNDAFLAWMEQHQDK